MLLIFSAVNAFLWRLTGAGYGPWRKIGWPVLIGFYGLFIHAPWWQIIGAVILAAFAVSRAFTYYGSDIHDHWFNWVWIWILGLYLSGPMIMYGRVTFLPFAWSLAATLSNRKSTARIFTWEFCECMAGFSCIA